jgi:hypothetical protein
MKSNYRIPVLITSFLLVSLLLNGQVKSPVLSGKEKASLFNKQIEMRNTSSFKNLKWQYIGPANISGRCTDVEAVSPRGGSYTIWVGSATGGVWKSVNEGTTFEPVSDSIATASIGDIAIDPSNPDVVWVGIYSEAQMQAAGYIKPAMEAKHGSIQDSKTPLQSAG